MSRFQKVLIVIFCIGIFLGGIGTGIGLLEFSSLTYAGEKEVGSVSRKIENFDFKFEPAVEKLSIIRKERFYLSDENIIASEEVPENTVRFQVTYNADQIMPYVVDFEDGWVGLDYYYIGDDSIGDEWEIFLLCKDMVLEGLKKREISSYKIVGLEDIKVLVNPASLNYVRIG